VREDKATCMRLMRRRLRIDGILDMMRSMIGRHERRLRAWWHRRKGLFTWVGESASERIPTRCRVSPIIAVLPRLVVGLREGEVMQLVCKGILFDPVCGDALGWNQLVGWSTGDGRRANGRWRPLGHGGQSEEGR
jgi:hypothetical protein